MTDARELLQESDVYLEHLFASADSIGVVYACNEPDSYTSVCSRWLPMLQVCSFPVITPKFYILNTTTTIIIEIQSEYSHCNYWEQIRYL